MINVYGFVPAWGLPCVSPFVTKVVNYLTMAEIPFKLNAQSLETLASDSPTAKLPYIVDDGKQVNDSTRIVQYLQDKYGDKFDSALGPQDKAVGLAFQRMVEEYTYWSGVIHPRWRNNEVFETYIPYLAPGVEVGPELRAGLQAYRSKIAEELEKQGMGLRTDDDVLQCLKEDIDALSDFLGDKEFLLGDEPSSFDATVYSTLRHITDVPWDWEGRDYARNKQNLTAYAERMRARFGI